MRTLGRALLLGCLILTNASKADETPDPSQVYIEGIKYKGNGCRNGSVAHLLSPDAKAFTLLFDDFIVTGDPHDAEKSHRKCMIDLNLHVPSGWSYAIFSLDYRGFVELRAGATATQKTSCSFPGSQEKGIGDHVLRGPLSEDYLHRTLTPLSSVVFSSCTGHNKKLKINTSISVKGEGLMTVDSADGELEHRYGIAWRRCPRR